MKKLDIFDNLGKKEIKAEDLAEKIMKNPDFLPEIFNGDIFRKPKDKIQVC